VLNPALELRTTNNALPVGRDLAARVPAHVVARDNAAFGDAHRPACDFLPPQLKQSACQFPCSSQKSAISALCGTTWSTCCEARIRRGCCS
jgi:hypothetical protein